MYIHMYIYISTMYIHMTHTYIKPNEAKASRPPKGRDICHGNHQKNGGLVREPAPQWPKQSG